jgi:hypothetical protein
MNKPINISPETEEFIKDTAIELKRELITTTADYLEKVKSEESILTLIPIFMGAISIYLYEMVHALYEMNLPLPKSKNIFIRDITEVAMTIVNEDPFSKAKENEK